LEWREAALEWQVEFVHCKNRRDQLHGGARPVKLHNPFAQRWWTACRDGNSHQKLDRV
jgi:hypothetical protein